ncbi:MAG: hypothetical protein Q9163_005212 [Psora crenata]
MSTYTEREVGLAVAMLKHAGPGIMAEINFDKVATETGYKDAQNAKVCCGRFIKKLAESSNGPPAPVVQKSNKRKVSDDAPANATGNEEGVVTANKRGRPSTKNRKAKTKKAVETDDKHDVQPIGERESYRNFTSPEFNPENQALTSSPSSPVIHHPKTLRSLPEEIINMPQKSTIDEQFRFLICCIRHSDNGKVSLVVVKKSLSVNFEKVANECDIVSKRAAAMRYERMMKAHGIHPSQAAGGSPSQDSPGLRTPPNKAATCATPTKSKKRKVGGIATINSGAFTDDEESFLTKIKVKPENSKKAKTEEFATDADFCVSSTQIFGGVNDSNGVQKSGLFKGCGSSVQDTSVGTGGGKPYSKKSIRGGDKAMAIDFA